MERNDLIERLRETIANADSDIADALLDAETTGEPIDPDDWHVEVPVDWLRVAATTIARLSEALAEAEKKGAEDGMAKCLGHIAYVRANFRMNPTDRVRFSVGDMDFAFRSALDVLKERITGEDKGKWQPIEDAAPPRDLSQGGQHG